MLSKSVWNEEDRLTSKCIDLVEIDDFSFKGDVRVIWPEALHKYLKFVFREIFMVGNEAYRDAVMLQLREMYAGASKQTMELIRTKTNYPKPLYKHQTSAVCLMVPHKVNLLSFSMRLGKEQPLYSHVYTSEGPKRMGDIKIGDKVFGSNGQTSKVTGVYPQGLKPVYRVYLSDGTHVDSGLDHQWIVINSSFPKRLRRRMVRSTKELIGDLGTISNYGKWYIPYTEPVQIKSQPTPIDPYFMGLLLGDGCFRSTITFSTDDHDLIPVIKKLLPSETLRVNKLKGNKFGYIIAGNGGGELNDLITIIRELGLFNKLSHEKFVPKCFLWNSIENRHAILQGLLDTDGHVNKQGNRISITTVSPELAKNIKWLVDSLGGHCRIRTSVREGKRDCFYMAITLPDQFAPFRLPRRMARVSKKQRSKRRSIIRIEELPAVEQQCISVDAEDHSYLTNNFTVTHNTITALTLSKILDLKRTLIIAPAGIVWSWFKTSCNDWGFDPLNWTMLGSKKSKCQHAFLEKYIVINYEAIMKHIDYLLKSPIDHIIIDEAHLCKNTDVRRTKIIIALIAKFPDARVTMLTGTPVTNRVIDFFAYNKIAKNILGKNKTYFSQRYLQKSSGNRGKVIGAQNLEELHVRNSNFMIRKIAEEVLDLPPVLINKYYMDETEISTEYQETLKRMYQNKLALAEAKEKKSISQMENSISSNVHTLNRLLAISKIPKVIEFVDKLWEEGRKVIIFSGYTEPLDMLAAHYKEKAVKVDGSVDPHKRSVLQDKFMQDKKCHVFLGNNKAAGMGIDLTISKDVLTLNFPFTPDDIEQPYKRAHGPNQKSTLNVYFTIVKDSIDEHIYGILTDKSRDINALIDNNKAGVVNYEASVTNMVFNKLIDQYAKDNNLEPINQSEFQTV